MSCGSHILFSTILYLLYLSGEYSLHILFPHGWKRMVPSPYLKGRHMIQDFWNFFCTPDVLIIRANVFLYFALDNSNLLSYIFNSILAKTVCILEFSYQKYSSSLHSLVLSWRKYIFYISHTHTCTHTALYAKHCVCLSYIKFSTPTASFYLFLFSQCFKYFGHSQTIFKHIYRMVFSLYLVSFLPWVSNMWEFFSFSFSFSCFEFVSFFSNDFIFQPFFLKKKKRQSCIYITLKYLPFEETPEMVKVRYLTISHVYW